MADHSPRFQIVKDFYDRQLWTIQMVHNAVGRWITEAEYLEITGEVAENA